MSVEFYRGSPGKFDSRTLSRKTLSRWTGRRSRGTHGSLVEPESLGGSLPTWELSPFVFQLPQESLAPNLPTEIIPAKIC